MSGEKSQEHDIVKANTEMTNSISVILLEIINENKENLKGKKENSGNNLLT
jgi:hypothetical protein